MSDPRSTVDVAHLGEVYGRSREHLGAAIALFAGTFRETQLQCIGMVADGATLIFTADTDIPPLPVEALEPIAWRWLLEEHREPDGPRPNIDGGVHKGWAVFNQAWGYVGSCRRALFAVRPVWIMVGK